MKLRQAARIRVAHRQKPWQAYSTRITHNKITVIQTLEDKEDKLHTTQEIEDDQWRDHRLRLPQNILQP